MKLFSYLPAYEDKPFFLKSVLLLSIMAISFLVTFIIGFLLALPFFGIESLVSLGSLNVNDPESIVLMKYLQVVNQIGVFILPAILYAYLMNKKTASYLMLNTRFHVSGFLLSVFIILAFIPAINWLVELNEQMKLPTALSGIEAWMKSSEEQTRLLTEAFLNVSTLPGLAGNLLIIGLLAAIGEELLFRGVILRLFREGLNNIHLAVVLSALLFSALHMQFYGFLPRAALGIVFGYIFVWTGSLWIPILLHFLFNGISVVAAYLYQNGFTQTDMESVGRTESSYIIAVSSAVTVVLLVLLYKNRVSTKLSNRAIKKGNL